MFILIRFGLFLIHLQSKTKQATLGMLALQIQKALWCKN